MARKRNALERWPRKIGPRVALFYFIVVVVVVTLSIAVYQNITTEYVRSRVQTAAEQTVTATKINLELMLSNMNDYSKLIFSNSKLQALLRRDAVDEDLFLQSRVEVYLYSLIQAVPTIDSVFVFDFNDGVFSASRQETTRFELEHVSDAQWYQSVIAGKGLYILSLNGGGAFSYRSEGNMVSMIRLIRDVNYASNLGIMVINISNEAFANMFEPSLEMYAQRIAIVDTDHQCVARLGDFSGKYEEVLQNQLSQTELEGEDLTEEIGGDEFIVTRQQDESSGWYLIGITNVGKAVADNHITGLMTLLIIVLNGVVLLMASILISHIFTRPIRQLLDTMNGAQSGSYTMIEKRATSDEFEHLFAGYNEMITRLRELHEQNIMEQEVIRKAELNVLQAQIKPHFLYNTLDSIVSLGMMGDHENVVLISRALSEYYRMSVSKGRDILTVGEEIEMVKNYMIIQKIRYQDQYRIHYDIDETCLKTPIPKLVIQPLVENAIYHGIRAKSTRGNVYIGVHHGEGGTVITVRDDGIGMEPRQISAILRGERDGDVSSFGLWGTMERMRIFCGRECCHIDSVPGEGTTIILTIPEDLK